MSETEISPAMISLGVSEVAPRAVGDLMHGLNTKELASRLSPLFTPWKRAMPNAPSVSFCWGRASTAAEARLRITCALNAVIWDDDSDRAITVLFLRSSFDRRNP